MIAPVQQIVPMQRRHIAAIAALEAASFSAPWDEASIRAELDNPLALWLVAEGADGGVLGYVGSQSCFEDADILNVCVAPEARRQGVAEALMRELELQLPAKGVEKITLEVRSSNTPAIRLYEKLGYAQMGVRRGYYEKPREDAWIMQKQLKRQDGQPVPYEF
ncbi:MAG: ribosomal protein S18-alanine N-acetyltransferase [Oscillospiraceae bacterium]|nr:ribosomal protein S18-alanine N-acetyltransferase [Oscillospiraceae bacterium]